MTTSPVHGGLSEPVNRIVDSLKCGAGADVSLPRITVHDVERTTLYRIADGTLSPLTGPMSQHEYDLVLQRHVIEREGRPYAWTIPIFLPVSDAEAAAAAAAQPCTALLVDSSGRVFGTIDVTSVYALDKAAFIKSVYRTERTDHPGARLWTSDARSQAVGGDIELLAFDDSRPFAAQVLNPLQVRALLQRDAYEQSIAFQTRNPLHRAHEYALVYGAETLVAAHPEKKTGVFLNPLVGQLKSDDVPAETRMQTYRRLVDERHLGEGDKNEALWRRVKQDLNDNLHLVGIDMRMHYGGPSEAVMHAIYRQNLGFTHFIIGRKHADAPFDDKTPIWGDFDAQEVFTRLNGELAISTVNVGFAAYFEELGCVGLVEQNKGKTPVNISGTKMREILNAGDMPDERVMRACTAQVLANFYIKQQQQPQQPPQ